MTGDDWDGERWERLPLDCDFDAPEDPEPEPELPPGWRFIVVGRAVRLAFDLPDISLYKRTA